MVPRLCIRLVWLFCRLDAGTKLININAPAISGEKKIATQSKLY